MKQVTFILLLLFLFAATRLTAQQKTVSGIVTDEQNQPLAGANVVGAGESNGAVTDARGRFTLSLGQATATLKVSYIGYAPQEVSLAGKNYIRIVLQPGAVGLNEVVAVGYGTQKKVNLTGSVSSVSGVDLVKRPVMRASAALEGMMPDVAVTQSSGQPGADGGSIRVRGVGTLGNSDPLVLIDGIQGTLDGVESNDIESMSVLKDASSSAIYGSRAANGVILVTTKRGEEGKLKVNYNAYAGWQRFTDLQDFTDGYTYMTALNQAFRNEGRDPLYTDEYLAAYQKNKATDPDHYPDVDWQKAVYTGSGFLQHHYLSVSGGSKTVRVMGSVAYQDQKGEIPNYESQRYSFRLNTTADITDNFQVRLDLSGRHSPTLSPAGGLGTYGVLSEVIRQPPIYPALLSDGRYGIGLSGTNPLARVQDGGQVNTVYESFTGTIQADYQPFKGAEVTLNFTPTYGDTWTKDFFKSVSTYEPGSESPAFTFPVKSTLNENDSRSLQTTTQLLLKYNTNFDRHDFHFLAGYEQIGYHTDGFGAFRDNFPLPDYQELNAGSIENWQNSGTAAEWALRSWFGRLNYDFGSKYLLEANLRVDGSSRFASGNQYSAFPSFSAGWRISEEPFLKDVGWLSELKLRGSWGKLGNQEIGNYPFASVINLGVNYIFGGAPANGAAQQAMSNRDISWEETTTSDVGVDIGLLDNKLNIVYDYYVRNTTGILLQLPIPAIVGLSVPYQNAGGVKNTGWGLAVDYRNHDGAFKYRIGFNLSDVKNEVVDLQGTGPYISDYTVIKEGYPINSIFGYKAIGIFQTQEQVDKAPVQFGNYAPGDIIYADLNGDGVIDADDRTVIGDQLPRFTFGLNFSAQYKDFDLSVAIQGVGKKDVFLYKDAVWAFFNAGKIQTWQLDYWTPENPDAKYPRLIAETTHNNFQNSSFWNFNSAYARLKNVQIGYQLPASITSRTFIEKLRVYVTGQNLFTLDHMPKGWDPERPSGNASVYPITSTYVFGIDLTF
ncbi:TonB-dependent receptor [Compostibacter hankyongensis]|uniref:TonB-dependent receptor n=1 Tax=Compostibacter hankyongensis TaxID=1007089 RepID=A0ABP8FGW6_9BACT